jgi:hypothetical protein
VGIDCDGDGIMKLNMYTSSSEQNLCKNDNELYPLLSSLDAGIIDAVITGQSNKQVHHWVKNIPIVSSINNGLYANILYLPFKWDKTKQIFTLSSNKVAIEGPIPICEKIFNKTLNCEFINPSSVEQ